MIGAAVIGDKLRNLNEDLHFTHSVTWNEQDSDPVLYPSREKWRYSMIQFVVVVDIAIIMTFIVLRISNGKVTDFLLIQPGP